MKMPQDLVGLTRREFLKLTLTGMLALGGCSSPVSNKKLVETAPPKIEPTGYVYFEVDHGSPNELIFGPQMGSGPLTNQVFPKYSGRGQALSGKRYFRIADNNNGKWQETDMRSVDKFIQREDRGAIRNYIRGLLTLKDYRIETASSYGDRIAFVAEHPMTQEKEGLKKVSAFRPRALYLMNKDGSGLDKLSSGFEYTGEFGYQNVFDFSWSPDGESIAFIIYRNLKKRGEKYGANSKEFVVVDVATKSAKIIGSTEPRAEILSRPFWSAHGNRIIALVKPNDSYEPLVNSFRRILTMDIGGENPEHILRTNYYEGPMPVTQIIGTSR